MRSPAWTPSCSAPMPSTPAGGTCASPRGDHGVRFRGRSLRRGRASSRAARSRCSCRSTRRAAQYARSRWTHFGGGIGDINASGRYDFIGRASRFTCPGIALLAGVTAPTGTAPESVHPAPRGRRDGPRRLANQRRARAGASLRALARQCDRASLAVRTPRYGETLAPQLTLLAAAAYTLPTTPRSRCPPRTHSRATRRPGGHQRPRKCQAAHDVHALRALPRDGRLARCSAGCSWSHPSRELGSNQPASGWAHAHGHPLMVLTARPRPASRWSSSRRPRRARPHAGAVSFVPASALSRGRHARCQGARQ